MKTVIILGDGMSDRPIAKLGGKTPLMVADIPNMDRIAREGCTGLFRSIPPGQPNGSAVANLSVLGYDPAVTFQGRAVLEAASIGIELAESDVAMRCNLIALDGENLKNHSAGHISSAEAAQIIRDLDRELGAGSGPRPVRFHPGVSYRHLLVLEGGWASTAVECAPPHDHWGARIEDLQPKPKREEGRVTAERLRELYDQALPLLADHPVNQKRRQAGKDQASAIWSWSPGRKPVMQTLQERFGVHGAVISAVDLIMGLGHYAGMTPIHVEGATGLHDTNYEGKAQACLEALRDHDLVYVHVEASDEAGHAKDLELKIRCIEYLDHRLIAPILAGVSGQEVIVAVLPDHPTPVELGCHTSEPVPVAMMGPGIEADAVDAYDEERVAKGSLGILEGAGFIRAALGIRDRD